MSADSLTTGSCLQWSHSTLPHKHAGSTSIITNSTHTTHMHRTQTSYHHQRPSSKTLHTHQLPLSHTTHCNGRHPHSYYEGLAAKQAQQLQFLIQMCIYVRTLVRTHTRMHTHTHTHTHRYHAMLEDNGIQHDTAVLERWRVQRDDIAKSWRYGSNDTLHVVTLHCSLTSWTKVMTGLEVAVQSWWHSCRDCHCDVHGQILNVPLHMCTYLGWRFVAKQ